MTVLALIGAKALYLLWIWLASAIVCSLLSARKGYGEKPGLATGLLTERRRDPGLAGVAGAQGLPLEDRGCYPQAQEQGRQLASAERSASSRSGCSQA